MVNLIIENIGRGPAHSISFKLSRPLPQKAFGIGVPIRPPEQMSSGPIPDGLPFLAPGQRITITWGQYGGLQSYIGDTPIQIDAFCYRGRSQRMWARRLTSASCVNIKMFRLAESAEHGYGPNLVKELKALNATMKSIEVRLDRAEGDQGSASAEELFAMQEDLDKPKRTEV